MNIPTKISQLVNDESFATVDELASAVEPLATKESVPTETHINQLIDAKLGSDVDNTTVFKKDGSIEQTYTDGTVIATVFNADGSITVTTKKNGAVIRTEKTVFNADGSITVTYTKGA